MSNQAYDQVTKKIISASNLIDRKDYFCPHPGCDAVLRICKSADIDPYFRSLKRTPHIDTCPFKAENATSATVKIPLEFDIHEFLEQLITFPVFGKRGSIAKNSSGYDGNGGSKTEFVGSITALSTYCIRHDIDSIYDGIHPISDFCIDARNVEKVWTGFSGTKLLIGNIRYFSMPENIIRLRISSKTTINYANVEVSVYPPLINELRDRILIRHAKIQDVPVAILCNCKYVGACDRNGFMYKHLVHTSLENLNQIYII